MVNKIVKAKKHNNIQRAVDRFGIFTLEVLTPLLFGNDGGTEQEASTVFK
jgi:hypothetical protein